MQLLKVLFIFFAFVTLNQADVVSVRTSLGVLLGTTLKSRLGTDFLAFRGIRYALAPVANLRFRNPKPYPAWIPNAYDATEDGPRCPQLTDNITDLSEDCLSLNVYTRDTRLRKPVIVYLHPGGFYVSSGQSKNFAGPEHLMDRDIVLVTINYRLGTLGFLAAGNAKAPGNAGLKDQVEALRWVQRHIENFGGDPNSVTLLGYSAGSFSIGLHMMSPMSRGLFHRAIMMSASPLAQFNYEKSQKRLSDRQAELLNCTKANSVEMVDCLTRKPMMDFVNTLERMFDFNSNPVLNWMPVIEEDFGQERFLVEDPYKTIQTENLTKVPLIIGITENEFIGGAYNLSQNGTVLSWLNNEFEKYAPIVLMYERDTQHSKEISRTLRSKYLNNTNNLQLLDSMYSFGKLYSDGIIGFEYHRFLDLISRVTTVYTYLFKYEGRYSHFKNPDKPYGAVHHDELLYLFHVPVMTPLFTRTDPENDIIVKLTGIWTEFAKTGNPNTPLMGNLKWKNYKRDSKHHLVIDKSLSVSTGGIFTDRFETWDKLFPVPKF